MLALAMRSGDFPLLVCLHLSHKPLRHRCPVSPSALAGSFLTAVRRLFGQPDASARPAVTALLAELLWRGAR